MRLNLLILFVCLSCVKPKTQIVEPLDMSLPDKAATLDDRLAFYEKYKVATTKTTEVYIQSDYGTTHYKYIESVRLNNGQTVAAAGLLAEALPGTVLDEHLNAATELAKQAEAPRRKARVSVIVGLIGSPLVVPFFLGIMSANAFSRQATNFENQALKEFDLIYSSYDAVLREKLGLCVDLTIVTVDSYALVDCPAQP